MPGPARHAQRLVLLVLGVALVLSGCAALPTEGPIVNSDGADASAARRASDISPRPPTDGAPPADVVTALGKQGIWIRDLADPACLRACTHITTSKEELVQLSEALTKHQG